MKRAAKAPDELRPEYDFASMPGGVRGKYAARYRQGLNIAKLDDDVSAVFPDAKVINDALRSLIRIAQNKVKGNGRIQIEKRTNMSKSVRNHMLTQVNSKLTGQ